MAREKIGSVKSGKGNKCSVQWNQSTKEVYLAVSYDLFFGDSYSYAGKASSAGEAINVAKIYAYNK